MDQVDYKSCFGFAVESRNEASQLICLLARLRRNLALPV